MADQQSGDPVRYIVFTILGAFALKVFQWIMDVARPETLTLKELSEQLEAIRERLDKQDASPSSAASVVALRAEFSLLKEHVFRLEGLMAGVQDELRSRNTLGRAMGSD